MILSGNTILITGGSTGIGLALAERFLKENNKVIIVGRREEKLSAAKKKFPQIYTRVCDVSNELERQALVKWTHNKFPDLNVLINNAGIQQRINLLRPIDNWDDYRNEVSINMDAPIHLSILFIPHLMKKKNATIINVSSGLAITPGAWVPVYSATKAGLHSFTTSLRLQLSKTNINVIEIFPPAVNTDLGGAGLHDFGVPLDEFTNAVFKGVRNGDIEIGYAGTENRLCATRDEIVQQTKQMWETLLTNDPTF
ncbi:SDR family oxidoreductase [Bacillus thuringiensis]|uniref:SDR family oxidoreductase n=1 Tax=Bacillus thuringiensis TaxID=1428 RepID=UPI002FBD387B